MSKVSAVTAFRLLYMCWPRQLMKGGEIFYAYIEKVVEDSNGPSDFLVPRGRLAFDGVFAFSWVIHAVLSVFR